MSWIESRPSSFQGYYLDNLNVDQAYLDFDLSGTTQDVFLYQLSSECLKCPFEYVRQLSGNATVEEGEANNVLTVPTAFPVTYRLRRSGDSVYIPEWDEKDLICDIKHGFGEFGIYKLKADEESCDLEVILEPVNIYFPLLIAFFMLFGLKLLALLYENAYRILPKLSARFSNMKPKKIRLGEGTSSRLISLDAFRGLCIILMIFVHDGGAAYRFMQHVCWDGLQVADVIFPWFLWIMGVCIPISLKGQYKKQIPTKVIVLKTLIRSGKLFILGLMLGTVSGTPTDLRYFRVFGVLQRFAVSYLLCTLLGVWCLKSRFEVRDELFYHRNSLVQFQSLHKLYLVFKDVIYLWKGWLLVLLLVLLHTLLIFLVPIPGCPLGYLGPGGLHNNRGQPEHCIGGVAGYVDRQIWKPDHLFAWAWANELYNKGGGLNFDPEGTLGFLTTLLGVWSGVQTGFTLLTHKDEPLQILLRLGVWAGVQGLLGGVLCGWKQTGGWIPVNKNLWSTSFVLVTNSMAIILLGILYLSVDVFKLWSGSPLMEAGMNSIFLYVVHLSVSKMAPWHWTVGSMNTHFLKLVESMWGISLWVLLAIWLHKKKIYYKV